jgi:hypothetical protein
VRCEERGGAAVLQSNAAFKLKSYGKNHALQMKVCEIRIPPLMPYISFNETIIHPANKNAMFFEDQCNGQFLRNQFSTCG